MALLATGPPPRFSRPARTRRSLARSSQGVRSRQLSLAGIPLRAVVAADVTARRAKDASGLEARYLGLNPWALRRERDRLLDRRGRSADSVIATRRLRKASRCQHVAGSGAPDPKGTSIDITGGRPGRLNYQAYAEQFDSKAVVHERVES